MKEKLEKENTTEKSQSAKIKENWNPRKDYEYVPGERATLPKQFEEFYQNHKTEWKDALDIGCGEGRFLIPMLQDGLNVTALDIANDRIERAKINLEKAKDVLKGNVQLVQGESKNLSFADNESVDYIFAKGTIHHNNWEGILQSFKEVKRVLKSGGIFTFQARSTKDSALSHSEKISDVGVTAIDFRDKIDVIEHYFEEDELQQLAQENGFEIVVGPEERIKDDGNARWWVVYKKK